VPDDAMSTKIVSPFRAIVKQILNSLIWKIHFQDKFGRSDQYKYGYPEKETNSMPDKKTMNDSGVRNEIFRQKIIFNRGDF
jgi:hypothetical protein